MSCQDEQSILLLLGLHFNALIILITAFGAAAAIHSLLTTVTNVFIVFTTTIVPTDERCTKRLQTSSDGIPFKPKDVCVCANMVRVSLTMHSKDTVADTSLHTDIRQQGKLCRKSPG